MSENIEIMWFGSKRVVYLSPKPKRIKQEKVKREILWANEPLFGTTVGNYSNVHKWLRRYYGNANRCENPECSGKSDKYEWSRLSEKKYEKKRQNFQMLCKFCHRQYDSKYVAQQKSGFVNSKNAQFACL